MRDRFAYRFLHLLDSFQLISYTRSRILMVAEFCSPFSCLSRLVCAKCASREAPPLPACWDTSFWLLSARDNRAPTKISYLKIYGKYVVNTKIVKRLKVTNHFRITASWRQLLFSDSKSSNVSTTQCFSISQERCGYKLCAMLSERVCYDIYTRYFRFQAASLTMALIQ